MVSIFLLLQVSHLFWSAASKATDGKPAKDGKKVTTVTSCCPALHIKWLNQLYRVCVAPAVLYAESILPFICIALIANLGHSSYVVSNAVCRQFLPTMLPSMTIPLMIYKTCPAHLICHKCKFRKKYFNSQRSALCTINGVFNYMPTTMPQNVLRDMDM